MNAPTQQYLKSILTYDPISGLFNWKISIGGAKKGSIAGKLDKDGYVRIGMLKKTFAAHRLAWLYQYGEWPPELIDHINGMVADNRISNLRLANFSQNGMNRKVSSNSSSGVSGVQKGRSYGEWIVRVKILGSIRYFGTYDDIELAALVSEGVREKYFGEFYPRFLEVK